MRDDLGTSILRDVSRSFYLTLRLLPREMRGSASLGYLLARTSDTLADTEGVPVAERVELLNGYAKSISRGDALPAWPEVMLAQAAPGEARLLARARDVLDWLSDADPRQAELVRKVAATIIGGQLLDLRRFGAADAGNPVALRDARELEDYAWSVAGCVGAFWTELGLLTLGGRYSEAVPEQLMEQGIAYGKGLQLVNILRDLPGDLAAGRCYLPVAAPGDREALMREFRHWHRKAEHWVGQGIAYASTLHPRRLRAATVLPALIAEETLDLLEDASWETLERRIKVPRRHVYLAFAEAILF